MLVLIFGFPISQNWSAISRCITDFFTRRFGISSQSDILEHTDPFSNSFCYLVIKQLGSLMAGKPKQMSQIKQLIRMYQGGGGIKTIAHILGMSKNTVRSNLKKTADGVFNTEELLEQEDPFALVFKGYYRAHI